MRNKILYSLMLLTTGVVFFQSCSSEQQLDYQRYYVNGKGLYEKNCQNCHGANGEGLGKLYPPLTDTAYLSKNKSVLACIIKNGLTGKITVNNADYETNMPANTALADIDIAQIIVYVTNSFGNKRGFYGQGEVGGDLKECN